MDYQFVEVSHASVHLALALLGLALACFFVIELHHENLERKSRQSKSLYSIEYSPQVNDSILQETELYANAMSEDSRSGHMTPRRVKRRSHTRNSARSNKSSLHRTRRSSARSSISSTRNKTVNPVTRLINQTGATGTARGALDSSTSNDENIRQMEDSPSNQPQYGQINPAYESSRPNSIYSASSRAQADLSRPVSALTSYSNFHGQRKPLGMDQNLNMNVTRLTQETVTKGPSVQQPNGVTGGTRIMNSSYDDLPPPPSPIAESPPPLPMGEAAAQVPVPQQRQVQRRNEYVNMPIQSSEDTAVSNRYFKYNHQSQDENAQTLKAQGYRLRPAPDTLLSNGRLESLNSAEQNQSFHRVGHSNGINGSIGEDDYGFTNPSSGPALPPKQPKPLPNGNGYLDTGDQYSMRPVGTSMHGGNCKCYRCQRKLTAI